MDSKYLIESLNDVAMIRTTLETLEEFRTDESLIAELRKMLDPARDSLVARFLDIAERFRGGEPMVGTNLREWRKYVVQLSDIGWGRRQLDSMMHTDVFTASAEASGDADRYRFDLIPAVDRERLRSLPPSEFAAEVFDRLALAAEKAKHYESGAAFDQCVAQHVYAVEFAFYFCADPMFYGENRE